MAIRGWLWAFCVVAGAAACGDDGATSGDDRGGGDVEEVGDEVGGPDGEVADDDAGGDADPDVDGAEDVVPETEVDGSGPDADAETDGDLGPADDDGDTVPAGEDCDDHDPLIVVGSVRECTSACGTGTEYCSAGAWVGCDAPIDCACSPPGSTRVVDCGRCGMASQTCGSDGVWEMPGTCLYEGECSAGETGTELCGLCGTRDRLCSAACAWMPWTTCAEHGVCSPGTIETVRTGCPAGQIQQRRCDDSCSWVVDVPCTTDCILAPRAGTYDADICVPGGPFIMGSEETDPTYANRMPVHEVNLSPYFIDRFPVTNARYRDCVDAGVCTAPRNGSARYYHIDRATYDSFPVDYVYQTDAITFCTWDGGRLLPTEAQWEKAARGPSPRENLYPWGDALDYCRYVNHNYCGTGALVAVDAYPDNASYYGVRSMQANLSELVRDYYDAGYYSVSPSSDPEGPATGTEFSSRGCHFRRPMDSDGNYRPITGRLHGPGTDLYDAIGFRCARQPWTD